MLDTVQSASVVQTVQGALKWFDISKGYGFIELAGRPDALVHFTRFEEACVEVPGGGSLISCDVTNRMGRLAVAKIHSVIPTENGELPRSIRVEPEYADDVKVDAVVKFYKPDGGYGILEQLNGEPDVFIHCTIMRKCGVPPLSHGMKVRIVVIQGDKGLKAVHIELPK